MIRARGLLLVAMLGAAGCSQVQPHRRPLPSVPPTFPTYSSTADTGPLATEIPWRTFFADPRLQGLIAQALESNRELEAAVLRVEQARAEYGIVRADRLPTVVAGATARFRRGASTGGTGGSGQGGSDTDPNGGTGGGDDGTGSTGGSSGGSSGQFYQIDVGATAFELDFWGRVRSLSAAARARFFQTVEARRAFQLSLINDLAGAYLLDRGLAERIGIAEQALTSRQESLRLARLRFEGGVASNLEVQQELILLTEARGELAQLQLDSARNRNLIALLVGAQESPALPPALPLARQGVLETLSIGLPSDLLRNRPDVRAAEQTLAAAGADVGAARAALFPTISLTGVLGFASPELGRLLSGDSFFASVSPDAQVPVFDAGRRRSGVRSAEAARGIAVADYQRTIQIAFQEVADALAGRRYLADQLSAQTAGRAAQAERARLAELRFLGGVADRLELLNARRELFATDQALVETRQAQLTNSVDLYTALGGGSR